MTIFTTPRDRTEAEALATRLEADPEYRVLRSLPNPAEIILHPCRGERLRIAILDTETSGLDPDKDELIEVAITIILIDAETGMPVKVMPTQSWLQQPSSPLSAEIERITGLSDKMLKGQIFDDQAIEVLLNGVDVIVAHNAGFDASFMKVRFSISPFRPWACSMVEVDWTVHGFEGRSQPHLLMQAGYFYHAHRAVTDSWALTCLLLHRADDGRPLVAHLIDRARQPTLEVRAEQAPYAVKDRLKQRGYRWSDREKLWVREINMDDWHGEARWLAELCHLIRPSFRRIDWTCRY